MFKKTIDCLGRNYNEIISEWKYITKVKNADIICLDNKVLFYSRKFKSKGETGKLMEEQFVNFLLFTADQERKKIEKSRRKGLKMQSLRV